MNLTLLVRWSGYKLTLGGLLLLCASLSHLLFELNMLRGSGIDLEWMAALFFFCGAIFLTLGLPGVYLSQIKEVSRFGLGAFFTALAGSATMIASDWTALFAQSTLMQVPGYEEQQPVPIVVGFLLNYGMYSIGWLLLGIAFLRERALSRLLAWLLIGSQVFQLMTLFVEEFPGVFIPFYLAVTWLGLATVRRVNQMPRLLIGSSAA